MTLDRVRDIAKYMLNELLAMKQTVIVVPDGRENSHRGIRCVVCPNPEWYSELCQQYLQRRRNRRWKRPRTIIKRPNTIIALKRISQSGLNDHFIYDQRLKPVIEALSLSLSSEGSDDVSSLKEGRRNRNDW